MKINRETHCIDQALSALLDNDLKCFAKEIDHDLYWPYVLQEFRRMQVDSLVYAGLQACLDEGIEFHYPVPETVSQLLLLHTLDYASTNNFLLRTFETVLAALNDKGVIPVLMGGTDMLVRNYCETAVRCVETITIFVSRSKSKVCHKVLLRLGYHCAALNETDANEASNPRVLFSEYQSQQRSLPPLRIFWNIVQNDSTVQAEVLEIEKRILSGSESIRLGAGVACGMPVEYRLLLCVEAAMEDSFQHALSYFDATALLKDTFFSQAKEAMDWDLFWTLSQRLNRNRSAYYFLSVLAEMIPISEPSVSLLQTGKVDLWTLEMLKRYRFNGRAKLVIQGGNAQSWTQKARLILQYMLAQRQRV